MATFAKRPGLAALASMAAWVLAGPAAYGQMVRPNSMRPANPAFQVMPAVPVNQAAFNLAAFRAASQVPPWAFGFNPGLQGFGFGSASPLAAPAYNPLLTGLGPYATMTSSTPYASPGYGTTPSNNGASYNPYMSYPDPYGGGLRGAAEAINAQGKYEVQFQQARLLNQEAERSKVDTRRKIFEEWLYERANTPTLQDLRERALKSEQRRVRLTPDLTDLVSGYALNTVLDDLEKRPNLPTGEAAPAIDPSILKQVNVKPKATAGNASALKPVIDGGMLTWPLPLQGADYQEEVRRLNECAAEAVKLVQNSGQADAATLNNMLEGIRKLRAKVSSHVNDQTWNQSVDANRFLNQLDEAVRALQQPNAANYFNNKFAAKGKTVADFVKYMASNGLEIAPAGSGDEAAYAALHNYLVGYANALQSEGGSTASPGGKE